MGLFPLRHSTGKYGVIIDIGSGSVLVAIVHSVATSEHPTIIWAHREQAPLTSTDSLEKSAKAVMSALVNATMKLDAEGRTALKEYDKGAHLSVLQTAISAPWAFTVTKTVRYAQDEQFEVSEHLIAELIATAEQQVTEELKEDETISKLGLTLITRTTMDMRCNGYSVHDPYGEKASELALSQATVATHDHLVDALNEMRDKLFPHTTAQNLSFILMLYCTMSHLLPHTDDVSLMDITNEATEMGVVRDRTLRYCTHTDMGTHSLVREIASVTNLPLTEVHGHLRAPEPLHFMEKLTAKQHAAVEEIFETYVCKVTKLFKETGDTLSIPKKIVLHTDTSLEAFFTPLIEKAAKRATKVEHIVLSAAQHIGWKQFQSTLEPAAKLLANDTAMLLNAQFFHKQKHCLEFNYL